MSQPQPVEIPDHTTTVTTDPRDPGTPSGLERWSCVCGAGGTADPDDDYASTTAQRHQETEAAALFRTMSPQQIADALRLGAMDDSARQAAVELVIAHNHWLWFGHLRGFLTGRWTGGRLLAYPAWRSIAAALDVDSDAARALEAVESLPYETRDALDKLIEARRDRRGEVGEVIHGSSSEVAILKIAASIVNGSLVGLNNVTSNLDGHNRGLVLTAIGHMLTHGGQVRGIRSAHTWFDYHQPLSKPS